MRPEKAKRIVAYKINRCLYNGMPIGRETLPALDKLLKKLQRYYNRNDCQWSDYHLGITDDYFFELMYISDRFNAPHRLLWMKAMIENNKFIGGRTYYEHVKILGFS